MKVAIHNGWLAFDNQLGERAYHHPIRHRSGRIRLSAVISYVRSREGCGDGEEPVTFVWTAGDADGWRLDGDHTGLLDGHFAVKETA